MLKILKVFVALQIFAFGYAYSQTGGTAVMGPECQNAARNAESRINQYSQSGGSQSQIYCNAYKLNKYLAELNRTCADSGYNNGAPQHLIDQAYEQAKANERAAEQALRGFQQITAGGSCYY